MDFNDLQEQILHPQDVSDMFTEEDIKGNKVIAALACFPILFWLPLAAAPKSGFAKFYANQGLILLICNVVLSVLSAILGAILGLIPFIGGVLAGIIGLVLSLISFAGFLLLFVSALSDKARELPIVGKMMHPFN